MVQDSVYSWQVWWVWVKQWVRFDRERRNVDQPIIRLLLFSDSATSFTKQSPLYSKRQSIELFINKII